MTAWEKINKFLIRCVNFVLMARSFVYVWTCLYPAIYNGAKSIKKRGYGCSILITGNSFSPVISGNYGSAVQDLDSVFTGENVKRTDNTVTVKTSAGETTGYGWEILNEPPAPIIRPASAGRAETKRIHKAEGIYSAIIKMDKCNIKASDSWWLISDTEYGYMEVDMLEMSSDKYGRKLLKSSMHTGKTAICERKMYNASYRVPDNTFHMAIEFGKRSVRIYVNGLLVWIGWMWVPCGKMKMIVNQGIYKDSWGDPKVRRGVETGLYEFKIQSMQHYKQAI